MMVVASRLGRLCAITAEPRQRTTSWPVVMVHGLGAGPEVWRNFQRAFAAAGVRSYALELPVSNGERAIGIADYALLVSGALAEVGPAVVMGHSMGGLIVQKLAETSRHPGYVMLASVPPWHMLRAGYGPMWRALLRHPVRQVLGPRRRGQVLFDTDFQANLTQPRLTPAQVQTTLGRGNAPGSARAAVDMALGWVPVNAEAIHSPPLLLIGGEADRLIPPAEQQRLARHLGTSLRLFNRGHMLMIEDGWEEISAELLTWMAALHPRRIRGGVLALVPTAA